MKKATLLVYVLTLSFYSFAQEKVLSKRSYNNFFAEAWGVTGWYSVNYERLIWRSPHNVLSLQSQLDIQTLHIAALDISPIPCDL